jgi:hypothetical protein
LDFCGGEKSEQNARVDGEICYSIYLAIPTSCIVRMMPSRDSKVKRLVTIRVKWLIPPIMEMALSNAPCDTNPQTD